MTDLPAPPPDLPKALQSRSRFQRAILSPAIPVTVSVVAILVSFGVYFQQAQNTQAIASTSQRVSAEAAARSELNAAINSRLQAAFCDLIVSVANVPTVPPNPLAASFYIKYRRSAALLNCPDQVYTIPTEKLQQLADRLNSSTPTPAPAASSAPSKIAVA